VTRPARTAPSRPGTSRPRTSDAPEQAVAERLAHFAGLGLLDVPDPRLAADHFNALTTLLAYSNQPDPALADLDQVRQTMTDGVHAFVRAYAARD
jgi:TetR/AcrR family transcriptional repressor of mexJK operon